jgi:tRNA-2-methylthio-N6-dimethylallyladenosine synthase
MKVYVETYGCQMNESDSEILRSILVGAGHELVSAPDGAEAVLLNACAVRENAHEKIYHRLDDLKGLKRRGRPRLVVGVLGCMAQNLKKELFSHPAVKLVVGPDNYRALPLLLEKAIHSDESLLDADLSEYETYEEIAPARVSGVNAWVAVMRGCDNFCTFCVVPYTRGRERSRPPEGILSEVGSLATAGYPQVTLLGQNVNSYRFDDVDFADLILKVADLPGIRRVRFTSPHPKDFPRRLLSAIASRPNVCKHVHLPLQAGSDRILQIMNRTYSRAEYLDLADEIRATIPGVSLTTDLIVGFPTETEEEFLETYRMVEAVRFDAAYIFKYSERKGTIAAREWKDDIPPETKTDRIVRLFDLQRRISLERNREKIGETVEVLVEEKAAKREGHWAGKSDANTTVIFPSDHAAPGDFVRVRVDDASASTLYGTQVR